MLDRDSAIKLAKICGMFGSSHDGERAAAALKADQFLKSRGLSWPDVISTHVAEPPPSSYRAGFDPSDLMAEAMRQARAGAWGSRAQTSAERAQQAYQEAAWMREAAEAERRLREEAEAEARRTRRAEEWTHPETGEVFTETEINGFVFLAAKHLVELPEWERKFVVSLRGKRRFSDKQLVIIVRIGRKLKEKSGV